MGIVAIANLIFYIEVPIYGNIVIKVIRNASNITTISYICNLKSLPFYQYFYIVYLVQALLIPFALMFASSLLTIRGLYKTRKRIEAHENREMKSRRAKDAKFAISSIFLDLFFVLLTTPIGLTYIINISDQATSAFVLYLCALFFSCNFSKSFFAYLLSNSIFRKEIIRIINSFKIVNMTITNNSTNNSRKSRSKA